MTKEFLKGIVKETLISVELLLENDMKSMKEDGTDLVYLINKAALMYDDLKTLLHNQYNDLSEERGLLILIEEMLPLTLLLCNKKTELNAEDMGELNKTFLYVKNLYIKVFGEYKITKEEIH
jgi:hypothetical protein